MAEENPSERRLAVAVLRFDDRNRYGENGIPTSVLFGGGALCIVNCKKKTKLNHWAKISVPVDFGEKREGVDDSEDKHRGELIELWGPIGDYAVELKAYQHHYGIMPCKYPDPSIWGLTPLPAAKPSPPASPLPPQHLAGVAGSVAADGRVDCTHLGPVTFSVDNSGTRDIDDALSFVFDAPHDTVSPDAVSSIDMSTVSCTIGIHIADVACRIACDSPLFQWAKERAASCYHGGVSDDHSDGGSIPMLPRELAHGEFSLNQGEARPAVSVWLRVESGQVVSRSLNRTTIVNGTATTYRAFQNIGVAGASEEAQCSHLDDFGGPSNGAPGIWDAGMATLARFMLQHLSNETDAEDLVAWSMIEYNRYLGEVLAAGGASAVGQVGGTAAATTLEGSGGGDAEWLYHACAAHATMLPARDIVQGVLEALAVAKSDEAQAQARLFDLLGDDGIETIMGIFARKDMLLTLTLADIMRFGPNAGGSGADGAGSQDTFAFGGMLRVQHVDKTAAVYRPVVLGTDDEAAAMAKAAAVVEVKEAVRKAGPLSGEYRHTSLGLSFYAHCSSPIRRFSDLCNQHALFGTVDTGAFLAQHMKSTGGDGPVALDKAMGALNWRVSRIAQYHANVDAMELAYKCRNQPMLFQGKVDVSEDGRSLLVYTEKRRVRVPLHDTYFADPIAKHFQDDFEGDVTLELFGVLLGGRTRLRVKVQEVTDAALGAAAAGVANMSLEPNNKARIGNVISGKGEEAVAAMAAGVGAATSPKGNSSLNPSLAPPPGLGLGAAEQPAPPATPATPTMAVAADFDFGDDAELDEATVNKIMFGDKGWTIDDFQRRCLAVIVCPEKDVLAMAPTGSGKTAVALMAILQAFKRGQRAVYTSPIKALSNQKYAEFKSWFSEKGVDAQVSLLTGDVKIRAPPGTKNELLICTSEILRNKLVKSSGVNPFTPKVDPPPSTASSTNEVRTYTQGDEPDADLERLGCVVSDEIHYINDVERGSVWEETLMHLPRSVQMVALSATLREPEQFLGWIERVRNRPGELVRRIDRHVPLHIGGLDQDEEFVELFATHNNKETGMKAGVFESSRFHALFDEKPDAAKAKQKADTAAANRISRDQEKAEAAAVARGDRKSVV